MPVQKLRRSVRRVARRIKSWSTIAALTLSGNRIERKADLHKSKNPVLLIYGFGATRRTFAILEKRLYNDGYTVFSINLGGTLGTFNTNPIEELASHIDQKIERLYQKYQFRGKISILAHSKGGLIGHYYIKRLGGDRRVKMLITMGTPHNGSPWALLASFTPAAFMSKSIRQMTPMSNFIRRLKQGPFPKKVKLYSIYSKDDRICVYPGGVLEEAANVKNLEIDSISHSEFLIKKSVYHVIRHALNDNMPASLEERTRQKVLKDREKMNQKSSLRLIEGAKNFSLKKALGGE
ncbi:alpha/beta fold hydrolase [bacterium]|nr:alpha/beta fold hydrolase [bacterium]